MPSKVEWSVFTLQLMVQKSQGQPPFGYLKPVVNDGIKYRSLNWWVYRFSEPSTVFHLDSRNRRQRQVGSQITLQLIGVIAQFIASMTSTWRIIPVDVRIVRITPIYILPPWSEGHLEGKQPRLGDLQTMVINHLLSGMILQVRTHLLDCNILQGNIMKYRGQRHQKHNCRIKVASRYLLRWLFYVTSLGIMMNEKVSLIAILKFLQRRLPPDCYQVATRRPTPSVDLSFKRVACFYCFPQVVMTLPISCIIVVQVAYMVILHYHVQIRIESIFRLNQRIFVGKMKNLTSQSPSTMRHLSNHEPRKGLSGIPNKPSYLLPNSSGFHNWFLKLNCHCSPVNYN